jgi:CDP-diacylglycerol--serine O-phosphatidyltransferase
MSFRKTYYLLPNLFTLSCVLCGFSSLSLAASGTSDTNLSLAALAIGLGLIFDTCDGRVARLTKTQSDLGRELDSLADVITFGAAPGLLVYTWGLTSFGRLGVLIAGLYVCAGAFRLARFNVLSERQKQGDGDHAASGKYFVGLPIPAAACVLVLMVLISHNAGESPEVSETSMAAIVLLLAGLMVSRIRFRTFKDMRFSLKTLGIVSLVVGACAATAYAGIDKALIFMVLVAAYIGIGLAEGVIGLCTHRGETREHEEPEAARST